MADTGLAIGTAAEGLARGLSLGAGLDAQKDNQAFLGEQRARQQQEWQQQDQNRARQEEARQWKAVAHLARSGAFDPATPAGQATINNIRATGDTVKALGSGKLDQQTVQNWLDAFNERHSYDINKGTGPVESDIDIGDGKILPKGSMIESKRVVTAMPGQRPGTVYLGIRMNAKDPEGNPVSWDTFVTEGRSSSADDPAKSFDLRSFLQSSYSDAHAMQLYRDLGPEKFYEAVNAKIVSLGGEPVTQKAAEEFTREEGNLKVTYQRDANGTIRKVAEAPRWQPEKATKAEGAPFEATQDGKPVLVQRYSDGTLRPVSGFSPKEKGRGMSVTLPDGTIIETGGSMTPPVKTQVQKDLIDAQDSLAKLRNLGPKISADYLTYVGRGKAAIGGVQDKAGMSTDATKFNADRSAALQDVEQFFNAYRKLITGAAAAEKELASLKKAVINSDLGPQEFQARYDGLINMLEADIARNSERLAPGGAPGQAAQGVQTQQSGQRPPLSSFER